MTDSDVWRAVWQHVAVAGLSLVNFVDTFPGHLKTSAILNNQSPAGRGTPRLCNGLGILGLDLVSDDDDSLAARTRLGLTRSSARDTNRHQHHECFAGASGRCWCRCKSEENECFLRCTS